MTDPRMGDALLPAIARLPRGTGVIFRHYGVEGRRSLYDRVRAIARARGLLLLLAGTPGDAAAWRADGAHGRTAHRLRGRARLRTTGAHDWPDLVRAHRSGVDAVLLSPVRATRSHPGGAVLGRVRFGLLARGAQVPVIALGGIDAATARGLGPLGARGWAGIDAFLEA